MRFQFSIKNFLSVLQVNTANFKVVVFFHFYILSNSKIPSVGLCSKFGAW